MKSVAFIENDKALAEINATLTRHPQEGRKKIGIFLPSGAGDIMTAMGVLRYYRELWGDVDIIWFCNLPNADVFKYNVVSEVRTYAWEGIEVDPHTQLKGVNNKLRQERKHEFEWSADLDDAYFPAPWMYSTQARHGIELPNISRMCFGIPKHYTWRPYLCFSKEERALVRDRCLSLPFKKTIMMETFASSGQSGWDNELTMLTMSTCRNILGDCNFIFASNKYIAGDEAFPDGLFNQRGVISLADLTIRQVALANDWSHLMVGVSSGISVATSHFLSLPVRKIQYCNSRLCSTTAIANDELVLISPDAKLNNYSNIKLKNKELKVIFVNELIKLLNKIK